MKTAVKIDSKKIALYKEKLKDKKYMNKALSRLAGHLIDAIIE